MNEFRLSIYIFVCFKLIKITLNGLEFIPEAVNWGEINQMII